MYYSAEFEFLKKVLQKMHLHVSECTFGEVPDSGFDFGLRNYLDRNFEYKDLFSKITDQIQPNTIYKFIDQFNCNYICLQLPKEDEVASILLIGPFLSNEITPEIIFEIAEQAGVDHYDVKELKRFYSNIPVIQDQVLLKTMINVFGETLWGAGTAFRIIDINQELSLSSIPLSSNDKARKERDILIEMKNMESRYAFENELIETVARGQSHRAELMMKSFPASVIDLRITDAIRNIKNYCIICNTLLRKAAEQGGVHPLYLDKVSTDYALRIEALTDMTASKTMMLEMIRSYCRLVRKHSMKPYSPPTQKAIAYIDADLSGDLSLRALSAYQGISSSYLSALFKKETGQTITDYVNQRRVQYAIQLLSTTKLQIQTIAQNCGISDVNYFSKIFKKYTQKTPKEFRKESNQHIKHSD